jgi:hypothetical protein
MMGAVVGGEVVGAGFVFGCPGPSVSLSTTVMDPKPTTNAATHASGITTARPPILAKNERRPSSSSAASTNSVSAPRGCGASVGAPSASRWPTGWVDESGDSGSPTGSVTWSAGGTPLAVLCEFATIHTIPQRIRSLTLPRSKPLVVDTGAQPPLTRRQLHGLVDQDDHEPEQRPGRRVLHDPHELVRGAIGSQVDSHPQHRPPDLDPQSRFSKSTRRSHSLRTREARDPVVFGCLPPPIFLPPRSTLRVGGLWYSLGSYQPVSPRGQVDAQRGQKVEGKGTPLSPRGSFFNGVWSSTLVPSNSPPMRRVSLSEPLSLAFPNVSPDSGRIRPQTRSRTRSPERSQKSAWPRVHVRLRRARPGFASNAIRR